MQQCCALSKQFHFCRGWEYSSVVTMVTDMCCVRKAVAILSTSAFSPNVSWLKGTSSVLEITSTASIVAISKWKTMTMYCKIWSPTLSGSGPSGRVIADAWMRKNSFFYGWLSYPYLFPASPGVKTQTVNFLD